MAQCSGLASPRIRVLVLLVAVALLAILYRAVDEVFFLPTLIAGAVLVWYSLSVRCPYCHKRQVLRGVSIFDLRLPGNACYSCGSPLCRDRSGDSGS